MQKDAGGGNIASSHSGRFRSSAHNPNASLSPIRARGRVFCVVASLSDLTGGA